MDHLTSNSKNNVSIHLFSIVFVSCIFKLSIRCELDLFILFFPMLNVGQTS
jgi:hypothetical protein